MLFLPSCAGLVDEWTFDNTTPPGGIRSSSASDRPISDRRTRRSPPARRAYTSVCPDAQIAPQMRSPATSSQGFDRATLPWRTPAFITGFRVALSVVSSIDLRSIHGPHADYTHSRRSLLCSASSARDDPQTSLSRVVTARSHQVRPQQGRAQQRNIGAATGSSALV
jgi:hypothetical protein